MLKHHPFGWGRAFCCSPTCPGMGLLCLCICFLGTNKVLPLSHLFSDINVPGSLAALKSECVLGHLRHEVMKAARESSSAPRFPNCSLMHKLVQVMLFLCSHWHGSGVKWSFLKKKISCPWFMKRRVKTMSLTRTWQCQCSIPSTVGPIKFWYF